MVDALTKIDTDTWMISGGFEGTTIDLTSITSGNSGGNAYGVTFHPDQGFIAVTGVSSTKQIAIYSWNGSSTISEIETINTGADVYNRIICLRPVAHLHNRHS